MMPDLGIGMRNCQIQTEPTEPTEPWNRAGDKSSRRSSRRDAPHARRDSQGPVYIVLYVDIS